MIKINKRKTLFWGIDVIYAVVFGLIIGADLGIDVSEKLNKRFG